MDKYIGIDYSLGQANVDKTNGIHYGVISQRSVGESWYESSEAQYGEPNCPKCGEEQGVLDDGEKVIFHESSVIENILEEELPEENDGLPEWFDGKDYACRKCTECFWSDECFSEEAQGFTFEDSEYTLESCFDNTEIFVLKSPYYTFAQFCSPCAPGAGNLDNPIDGGVKTYCLGSEWFEDKKAPYPVYRVADDTEAKE
jgi:hypothetical protein